MLICGTRSKFVAVSKFGIQDQGLDQLSNRLLLLEFDHELLEQLPVLGTLRITRRTLKNLGIQLIDHCVDPGIIRTKR